ncbi:mRNA export factor Gle1-like [Lutzomyia longipalpis]|uniref:mRNA export factor Gle1-like n=1 Tax=Lutzomyia longipalpis TaxID=7200 RepID=UPI0024844080|nr:mRNA export factor Gle1-like [Lutzomyia longipalpis]
MNSRSYISFALNSHEQSILANAARISPQVRGPTIGPNAADLDALTEGLNGMAIGGSTGKSPKEQEEEESNDIEPMPRITTNIKEYIEDIARIRKVQSLEKQRKDAVQKEVRARLSRQRMQQSELDAIYEDAQKNLQRKLALLGEEAERRVKQALEEQEKLNEIQEEKMREAMLANSKRVDSQQMKLKQFREKQKMNVCIEALQRGQEKFVKCFETFARTLMSIEKAQLPNYMALNEKAKPMMTTYEQTIKSIAAGNITEGAVKVIDGLVEEFQKLQQELEGKIAADAKEAAEKVIQQEVPKAPKEKPSVDQVDTVHNVQGLNQFISPEGQKQYIKVMDLLIGYTKDIEPLTKDESLKKFRFNCQKAINIPVNAISGVSAAHLKDKYDKLACLLSGNTAPCGDEQINAGAHPLGKKFCMVLLAKKFVNQGDTMVASNPKAAYPIAAVIVALWQKFPDFGDLFLAHAYRECPYLVPYFIPQFEGQSTEEYYRALGYKTTNDTQEPQDMYLKRMSGIARLYAAIFITKPRMGETQSNPHCLKNGWMWLCNVLNMDPLPDICATVLLEVLQIVGDEMIRVYGRQFLKLIFVIHNQYLPKLKLVDEGGPRVRLEVLLAKVMKEGKFDQPEGVLHPNFW